MTTIMARSFLST